jgi:hypothetical protein
MKWIALYFAYYFIVTRGSFEVVLSLVSRFENIELRYSESR